MWISCICTHTLADSHTDKIYKNKQSETSYGLRQAKRQIKTFQSAWSPLDSANDILTELFSNVCAEHTDEDKLVAESGTKIKVPSLTTRVYCHTRGRRWL